MSNIGTKHFSPLTVTAEPGIVSGSVCLKVRDGIVACTGKGWTACQISLLSLGTLLVCFGWNANAQDRAGKTSAQAAATAPAKKPGSIVGTILDQSGSVAVGAVVRLTTADNSFSREVVTGDNGQFSFSSVPPGPFKISVNAAGFGDQGFSGVLAAGQTYLVAPIVISIATVVTDVKVNVDPVEVATEEVREEEHQRVLGILPNFYVTYHADAAPLTTKLKFRLAWKSSTDPVTIGGTAFLAGLQQAGDQYPEFGQGMEGYGKRLGAGYGDVLVSTFLSGAVFPSLLKQDPRYYFQGTGGAGSRLFHAVSNSWACKGDNGRRQINYSNLLGVFGGAAVASYLYPTSNRATFTLSNGMIRLGESSLAGFVQEFVVPKLSKQAKRAKQEAKEQAQLAAASAAKNSSASAPRKP